MIDTKSLRPGDLVALQHTGCFSGGVYTTAILVVASVSAEGYVTTRDGRVFKPNGTAVLPAGLLVMHPPRIVPATDELRAGFEPGEPDADAP